MPQSTRANRIEQLCADKRLRMTGQRRVIARVLSDGQGPSRRRGGATGAPTRSIRASRSPPSTARCRLFETKASWSGTTSAPAAAATRRPPARHHDHLIDLETGQVIEFRNEEIERLQQRVAQELGFQLVGHKLELYGVPTKRPRAEVEVRPCVAAVRLAIAAFTAGRASNRTV